MPELGFFVLGAALAGCVAQHLATEEQADRGAAAAAAVAGGLAFATLGPGAVAEALSLLGAALLVGSALRAGELASHGSGRPGSVLEVAGEGYFGALVLALIVARHGAERRRRNRTNKGGAGKGASRGRRPPASLY